MIRLLYALLLVTGLAMISGFSPLSSDTLLIVWCILSSSITIAERLEKIHNGEKEIAKILKNFRSQDAAILQNKDDKENN